MITYKTQLLLIGLFLPACLYGADEQDKNADYYSRLVSEHRTRQSLDKNLQELFKTYAAKQVQLSEIYHASSQSLIKKEIIGYIQGIDHLHTFFVSQWLYNKARIKQIEEEFTR